MSNVLEWLTQRRVMIVDFLLKLRSSLWLRPMCWLFFFTVLAIALTLLEAVYIDPVIWEDTYFLWRSQAEGARTMLGAIAGAILTVVSLAFSLMMVVVIQTANAYTPRLLRQYIGDTHNHHVLGLLTGSFAYSILVLRAVRSEPEFVPHIAVNVALVLSTVCIIALISFIHHVARSIEVGNIIKLIEDNTWSSLAKPHYQNIGQGYEGEVERGDYGMNIRANHSGYIRVLDTSSLETLMEREGFMMELHYTVGEHVMEGAVLATVWRGDADEGVRSQVHEVFVLGKERAWSQDTRYGFHQLTDIALRALSPGINDPTTAIMAFNAVSNLFGKFMARDPGCAYRADERNNLCLIFPQDDLRRLINESIWPIFDYGRGDFQMVLRLVQVLGELGEQTFREDERALFGDVLSSVYERVEVDRWSMMQVKSLDENLERAHRRLRLEHPLKPLRLRLARSIP